jgi:hypothetical protein
MINFMPWHNSALFVFFIHALILGTFAKLLNATIICVMSVCPSVRPSVHMELGSHRTEFHEISYLNVFRISAEKTQVSFMSDKNIGYFT